MKKSSSKIWKTPGDGDRGEFLLLVGAVLGAVVGAGVGGVAVGAVGLLLLVVDGHEVLHVHRLLTLLVCTDADRRQAEEDS